MADTDPGGMDSRPITVLIEIDSSDLRNGAVNDAFDLAHNAGRLGARFVLCGAVTADVVKAANESGMSTCHGQSQPFAKRHIFRFAVDVVRWAGRLRAMRIDVVHQNYLGWGQSLVCAAYLLGIPVVARAGGDFYAANPSNRWISAYVANCRAHAASLLKSPLASKVVITGPLLRMDRLLCKPEVHAAIPPKTFPRFVFLGQIVERKGLIPLIHAFAGVSIDVELLIVGGEWPDHGYPREVVRLVETLGLGDRVSTLHHRRDIRTVLDACDVLVLPSLSDAQPRVIIEAMFAGLPVVSTFVGGIPELVADGKTGILCQPNDVGSLSAAIEKLGRSGELRKQFGEAGRLRAEAEFRPEQTAMRYLEIYRRLLLHNVNQMSFSN